MTRYISTLLAFLIGLSKITAQDVYSIYETIPNADIPCRVMKPIKFDSAKKYPVILSLHGAGGKGTNNRKQLKDWNRQLADPKRRNQFPCYVVAPQAPGLWNGEQLKIIQKIIAELPSVDLDRIYIMGHSMGGHGTYIYIQLAPKYFAAAAPSAGSGLKRTEEFIDPEKIKDTPIWAFHGDKDRVCPYEKQLKVFNALKKLNGNMKLTTWRGDNHGVSGKMIEPTENGKTELSSKRCDNEDDFLTWLFKQRRNY